MKRLHAITILVIVSFFPAAAPLQAQDNPLEALAWQIGPTDATIGTVATIHVPEGYVFLGAEDTRKLMELMENIPREHEYVFAPDDLNWYAVFEFSEVGYVDDDETIDAQSLLDTVTAGNEQGNIERQKRGWSTMTIMGWRFQPRYDKQSNLLEWALVAKEDASNSETINYNTRLLGRSGVMEVVLAADPKDLDAAVAAFKNAIGGFKFVSGQQYADYREGDRVAEFGLAALIAGGAAAVATKKGFWAAIVTFFVAAKNFLIAIVIGAIVWVKSLFKRKS